MSENIARNRFPFSTASSSNPALSVCLSAVFRAGLRYVVILSRMSYSYVIQNEFFSRRLILGSENMKMCKNVPRSTLTIVADLRICQYDEQSG
jgi:hypothetical protein